ncbi:MAG: hypothetical protein HC919_06030 [Oscillatoriales cyanobacterium SM2_2_1]|nr:hypothetical protein [Oscillatoriales cyanobacterium SM2_2_1]
MRYQAALHPEVVPQYTPSPKTSTDNPLSNPEPYPNNLEGAVSRGYCYKQRIGAESDG